MECLHQPPAQMNHRRAALYIRWMVQLSRKHSKKFVNGFSTFLLCFPSDLCSLLLDGHVRRNILAMKSAFSPNVGKV